MIIVLNLYLKAEIIGVNHRELWISSLVYAIVGQIITIGFESVRNAMLGISESVPLAFQLSFIVGFIIAGVIFWYDYKNRKKPHYDPNPQEYWEHIKKIRKSLEADIANFKDTDLFKSFKETDADNIPNFYKIIKKSAKKTELLQHLFTYFTYPEQRKGDFSWNYVVAHMVETESKLGHQWKEEAYKLFNKEFQHVYEIMDDSKPLVGLCDGCKMDYYGEDKEKCLYVLENFHRDKDGFIRKLFYD